MCGDTHFQTTDWAGLADPATTLVVYTCAVPIPASLPPLSPRGSS
jgi:hypothetical protein